MIKKKITAMVAVASVCMGLLCGCQLTELAKTAINDRLESIVVGEAREVDSISTECFAYQQLVSEERVVYDQILNCILEHEDVITVSTKDTQILEKAYACVMADYGGLFWVSGYQYNTYSNMDQVIGLEFAPNYLYSKDETTELQRQVDAVVTEWLSDLSADADDYTKSKYVFELLIDRVDYVKESENNQNILSIFLNQQTVCQGYADATQYLLQQLGIQATVITGQANGENHAWNLVRLDGEYYYIDTTWGNSKYLSADETKKRMNYAYLNATTQDLLSTHQSDMPFALPACEAVQDNYFWREGCYFQQFDASAAGQAITDAYVQQRTSVALRFASEEGYRRAISYFLEQEHVFDYCSGLNHITYMQDDSMLVLTFLFNE